MELREVVGLEVRVDVVCGLGVEADPDAGVEDELGGKERLGFIGEL